MPYTRKAITIEDIKSVLNSRGKILLALHEREEIYRSQLARETGLSYVSLTRILPKMEADELIESRKDRSSSRVYYRLNSKGKELASTLFT